MLDQRAELPEGEAVAHQVGGGKDGGRARPTVVAERAARGPCRFRLLAPRPYWDPDTEEVAITLELAIRCSTRAWAHMCKGSSATDPYEAVRQTLEGEKYDEVIVSTLSERVSRWPHLDLAHRIKRFGVPVSVVTAEQAEHNLSPGAV